MSQTLTTFYRPGLVFKAKQKSQGHDEICRKYAPAVLTPDGGAIVREPIRELVAEFGVYGSEYTYEDPLTGTTEIGSEFRGGYFNLDEQAAEKGWDDVEKEVVARHMLQMLNKSWCQFTLYSKPKVAAPWPTYDSTHHSKIVEIAKATGTESAALAYERQEKNRPSVVAGLQEAMNFVKTEPVAELVAD